MQLVLSFDCYRRGGNSPLFFCKKKCNYLAHPFENLQVNKFLLSLPFEKSEMPPTTIILKPIEHRNQQCIGLYFDYNREIINTVKTIKGARWSQTKKCWYVPYKKDYLPDLQSKLGGVKILDRVISETFPAPAKIKISKKNKIKTMDSIRQ
jgi:hypothetical protein